MEILSLVAVVFAVTAHAATVEPNATSEVIPVTVYFESYCPDSIKFLTTQLYPLYLSPLAANMNISLVPYGKSTMQYSTAAGFSFTCHHGPKECVGNKVLSCVLHETIISLGDKLKFINCTSSILATNPKMEEYPVKKCPIASLSEQEVNSCAGSDEGSEYLAENGNRTEALNPKLSSVPTVVFNNKFEATDSQDAVANFRKALCSKLTKTKPAECLKGDADDSGSWLLIVAGLLVALLIIIAGLVIYFKKYNGQE